MKIVAINGSPKGQASHTHVMVSALLRGARTAGAEVVNIFLSDKDIHYCKGCYSCWKNAPGKCIIADDMAEVLLQIANAHVVILATPLYFNNISGTLKVFIDRLTVTGSPHSGKDTGNLDATQTEKIIPKLVMMANCGFAERSQFQVVSLWIKRVAAMMQTELLGEIYATQGKFLLNTPQELQSNVSQYLQELDRAGQTLARRLDVSGVIGKLSAQSFAVGTTG